METVIKMITLSARRAALAAAMTAGLLLSGCHKVEGRQGFNLDETLVSAIQVGTDNKDSVANTLGRPSFSGTFSDNDWYYVSRSTRNMGYNQPHAYQQTILHVRFDANGNVAAVERKGMEQVATIHPDDDKTPTLGRHKSLWDELFGNIGAVGSGNQKGHSTDNPGG
jgi:outer membrane protein assembly factor BamE (lipoprotein component of BamABCDE complex)